MRQLIVAAIIVCIAVGGCGKRQWSENQSGSQPTVKNMTIDQASGQSSEGNLKSLALGLMQYCQDYDEAMPPMTDAASAQRLLQPYVSSASLWVDPRTGQAYGINPSLAGRTLGSIVSPAQTAAFYETSPRPNGVRAVAFADGHVDLVRETQWPQVKQASGIP